MKLKYIEDYYDKIKERFPDLEDWEIDKILKHGFRSLYTLNSQGGDVLVRSAHNSFAMYFGKLFKKRELFWKYHTLKWRIKLRIKYFSKDPVWDGNYYFGLTEEEYNKYIPKKKGRIKKKIKFEKLHLFKIKEESFLFYKNMYFFRLTGLEDEGVVVKKTNFSTRNIELIAKRDSNGKVQSI